MKTNKEHTVQKAKLILILDMIIFGTLGVFRRFIPVPSGFLAMTRGCIAFFFILSYALCRGVTLHYRTLKGHLKVVILGGIAMGLEWMLLFEAYAHTTVAAAVLCYYMCPIFVILASPFILHESLTRKKLFCVAAAFVGIILVSGIIKNGFSNSGFSGILFGLTSAIFYAVVVLTNKFTADIPVYEKTMVQVLIAAAVILPYTLLREDLSGINLTPILILQIVIMGCIHTGLATVLFFIPMRDLSGQTFALYTYLDPVIAIILSAIILHESIGPAEIIGAFLILGAAYASDRIS